MIEEERRDVIVVDEQQDVGPLVGEPALNGLVGGEDRRPDWVARLVVVERESDRGRVGRGNGADDVGHGGFPQVGT